MSLAAVFLNAAYVVLVASAYTRTVAWLRALLIAGSAFFIAYGLVEQIWAMVVWNAVILISHLVRIIGERRARNSVELTPDECAFRDELFPGLGDYDFNLLWSMGRTVAYDNEAIIEAGSLPGTVSVVAGGTVNIDQAGETMRTLTRGALLGEMSFVSGDPAAVDVIAGGAVTVRQWDQRQLLSLDQAHPPSARAFRELIGRDLARKSQFAMR